MMRKVLLVVAISLLLSACRNSTTPVESGDRATTSNSVPATTSALPNTNDIEVLSTAIRHFVQNEKPRGTAPNARKILIFPRSRTTDGMLSDDQLESELRENPQVVSSQLIINLRERNAKNTSLEGLAEQNPDFVLDDLSRLKGEWPSLFWEVYPDAKCWIDTWLPGYSQDGNEAVVKFWFGPTSHGATAIYVLQRKNGKWKVMWNDYSYYL
jgi:hypothetical protein